MTLSSDNIVEASLLNPMGDECRTAPTLEEEAAHVGEEIKLPPVPGSSPKPAKQSTTPTISSPLVPQSNCHPSSKANESWKGIDADLNNLSRWVCFYLQENAGKAPSLMSRAEPLVGVTAPSEPSTLEPGEATPPEELTLVPRWRPLPPLAFPSHGLMHLTHPHQNRQTGL